MTFEISPTIIVKGETYTPPKGAQESGQRALDWLKEGLAGKGFTPVGRKRASDLARGADFSYETVKRMKAYFDRHQVDKKAEGFNSGEKGFPSPGRVAWEAWGGDAGWRWATTIVERVEKGDTAPYNATAEALVIQAEQDSRRGLGLQRKGKYEGAQFAHESAVANYRQAAKDESGMNAEVLNRLADEAQQAADYCAFFAVAGEQHSPAEINKGDFVGHAFHGNQWTEGTGTLEPSVKTNATPITDTRAKYLAKLYEGTFRYTPGGVNFVHRQELSNGKLAIRKVAFEAELNARLSGEHLQGENIVVNDFVAVAVSETDEYARVDLDETPKIAITTRDATQASKDVNEFMQAISERATPLVEDTYRGMRLDPKVKFTVGQELDLPVSSWGSKETAADYMSEKESKSVLFKIEKSDKALGVTMEQMGYKNPDYPQTITGGRFEVKSVSTENGVRVVTLSQKQFYAKAINPNWKTEEPNLFPAWFPPDFSPTPTIAEALIVQKDAVGNVPAYPGTSYENPPSKKGANDWGWLGAGKKVSLGVTANDLADDSSDEEDDTTSEDTSER